MHTALDGHAAHAHLAAWPNDPEVLRVVLVDHRMIPTAEDVEGWITTARRRGARALRTGALFSAASDVFSAAGFAELDRLLLLRRPLPARTSASGRTRALRRLRPWQLDRAARLDQRAFGLLWGNDVASLEATRRATPTHRARVAFDRSELVGLAICGRAGETGYVQRLAVDPAAQRRGIGRDLVLDGLSWMARRGATSVLVNTSTTNAPAIALYRGLGFQPEDERLAILEHPLTPRPTPDASNSKR